MKPCTNGPSCFVATTIRLLRPAWSSRLARSEGALHRRRIAKRRPERASIRCCAFRRSQFDQSSHFLKPCCRREGLPNGVKGHVRYSEAQEMRRAPGRAPSKLYVEPENVQGALAHYCLRIMQSELLHFNVSRCSSSYLPTASQTLSNIRISVLYACLNWATHLASTSDAGICALIPTIEQTLRRKFLFWVEVIFAYSDGAKATEIIWTVLDAVRR